MKEMCDRRGLGRVCLQWLGRCLLIGLLGGTLPSGDASALPAFPGAVGFGGAATGGRGGDVYHVTHLGDVGPGSLREGIATASGPRTIVFEVSGTIDLASPLLISASDLTLAGQTSPGGIGTRGYPVLVSGAHDVVIRYMRFRTGDLNAAAVGGKSALGNGDLVGDAADALTIAQSDRIIVDHVSTSWGIDETLSVTLSSDVTVQHSVVSESLNDSYHPEGPHGYGSLLRGKGQGGYSFVGNLYAHHVLRSPAVGGEQTPPPGQPRGGLDIELINNVVFDWQLLPGHTVEGLGTLRMAYRRNVFIAGPNTSFCAACAFYAIDLVAEDDLQIYQFANLIDYDRDGSFGPIPAFIGNFAGGPFSEVATPFAFARPDFPILRAGEAYSQVIAVVGASLPRDAIDDRIVQQLSSQTGSIINSQNDVGGWPAPPAADPPPPDLDRDGMADDWEQSHGLNPNSGADRNDFDLDADYTNLEIYLAQIIDPEPVQPVPLLVSAWGRALLLLAICAVASLLGRSYSATAPRPTTATDTGSRSKILR